MAKAIFFVLLPLDEIDDDCHRSNATNDSLIHTENSSDEPVATSESSQVNRSEKLSGHITNREFPVIMTEHIASTYFTEPEDLTFSHMHKLSLVWSVVWTKQ